MSYAVKEIFYTLQGEGFHAGRPAVFCRFSGCNLWSGREADRAMTTLPAALYSPVSQIVVDVTYTFQPTFGAQYFGGATIARSYYVSPRNVNFVEMSSGSTLAQNCSGAP